VSALSSLDYSVVAIYAIGLIALATWISRQPSDHERDANDYFLAGRALPWWAVGASLIAANISAEQIIGMSGSGYALGLAIASYEWMAAITLVLVGKFILPVLLRSGVYTMPQFLEQRYDHRVRTVMALFWLGVYVFVNLTSVLWLGALAISSLTGLDMTLGLLALAGFALAYSLYGGLRAVAMTDIIQVVLLVLGGLLVAWISLDQVSGGAGALAGFSRLLEEVPGKFDMILSPDNPEYKNLPGLGVLLGGMWVMNLSYWGFNQYIIQRALAAESLREAQKGILFAAFLKLLMPLIIVVPGIAAVLLAPDLAKPDQAYPEMMKLAPSGIRGLIFAALVAAIVSSVGSMMNSVATIFTMDLLRPLRPQASSKTLVRSGRIVGASALLIAVLCARPLLGNFEQAFQYIQEFTGFFTPGICAIFLLGVFVPQTSANGALVAAVGSFVLSVLLRWLLPEMPFMDRVGYVFLLCCALALLISWLGGWQRQMRALAPAPGEFRTGLGFNLGALLVAAFLVAVYAVFW
jgi:solute:Na+ symporter, SSS family